MPTILDDVTRAKDRYDYQRAIRPNTYLVLHLQPWLPDELYGKRIGTADDYDRVAYRLVANISREVLGYTAYRKRPPHRKRLPNLVTLEDNGGSPHLNVCIQRPERWAPDEFEAICRLHFEAEEWFRKHPGSFFCEDRLGNCAVYALKSGAQILGRSMSFCR